MITAPSARAISDRRRIITEEDRNTYSVCSDKIKSAAERGLRSVVVKVCRRKWFEVCCR